ncbi:MAG: hypothetical protein WEA56_00830 [Balneolaceae bacterium]
MAKPTITTLLLCVALLFGAAACGPSLVIQDVDYSQPIESVLAPDANNEVHDQRYAIKFNISSILENEGTSSIDEIRLIRNRAGYYFVTANGFNSVYVFEPGENELKLKTEIELSEDGLGQPAFNLRNGNIELLDRDSGDTYNLDQNGRR